MGWGAGRWGENQSQDSSSHLPCAPQVLRGGDPAEGQDFPADADGEGGNAHQGGPAWGPCVSAAWVGAGHRESAGSDSSWGPEGPFPGLPKLVGAGAGEKEEEEVRAWVLSTGSSGLTRGASRSRWAPGHPRGPLPVPWVLSIAQR